MCKVSKRGISVNHSDLEELVEDLIAQKASQYRYSSSSEDQMRARNEHKRHDHKEIGLGSISTDYW